MKPGRNDPCHCGSGQKYKKCHLAADDAAHAAAVKAAAEAAKAAAETAATETADETEAAPTSARNNPPARASGTIGGRAKLPAAPPPPPARRRAV